MRLIRRSATDSDIAADSTRILEQAGNVIEVVDVGIVP